MPRDGIAIELSLILVLILLNGFFAGAEIAVVSARVGRLRALADEGRSRARAVLRLKEDPDRFLATVQVGITLVSTLASAVGGVAAIERLEPLFAAFPVAWLRGFAEPIAVGIVVFSIAYLSLVVGELVPKSLAVRHAETIALWSAPMIEWLSHAARPAVSLLTASSRLVLRVFGRKSDEPVQFHALEELRAAAHEAAKQVGVSEEVVTGAVEFHERDVREVMTPRPRIAALPASTTIEHAVRTIRQTGHSRYPVYQGGIDDVIGFVHARDIYEAALDGTATTLASIVSPALSVPETMPATQALEHLRREGQHLALVIDEHGSLVGLITMEDLIEVIVGEIEDEHRVEVALVRDLGGGRLQVEGSVPIHELATDHELVLPESEDYVTLAGLVLTRLGHIPRAGESVEVEGRRLTVLTLDGARIARVLVEPLEPAVEEEHRG
jgi:putative hemolysin